MEFSFGSSLADRRLFLFTMGESCRAWDVIILAGIDLFLACLIDLIDLNESKFFAVELELLLEAKQLPELTWSCGPLGAFLMHLALGHSGLTSVLRNRIAAI